MSHRPSIHKILALTLTYLLVAALLFAALLPFYWMLVTAFRPQAELYSKTLQLLPSKIVLENFRELFFETGFLRWFINSWYVAALTTIFSLVAGSLAAYSLVRFTYRGRNFIARSILITYLVPRTVLFIPLYRVIRDIGLFDTLPGLMLAYTTFALPFCTWMLIGYFRSIPDDMELAAMIDGCSRMQSFWHILLPVAAPGLVASGVFSFNLANNEYLYALTYIDTPRLMTLPRGLSTMIMGDVYLWGPMMAAALAASLPLVIFYMYFQKFLVQGVTAGSVKG